MPSAGASPPNHIRHSRPWLGASVAFMLGAGIIAVLAPMVRRSTLQPVEPLGCLCYRSVAAGESALMTACRRSLFACDRLREDVERGGVVGADPGSVGPACTAVYGEHPGDVLVGRDAWQSSLKQGGFVSHTGCLLSPQGAESSQVW